jgi:hypothetical protein
MALEDFRADMERCSHCSYCKFIPLDQIKSRRFSRGCPSIAYNNFNAYSARGRFAVGLSLLNGQSDYTDRVSDIVFKCMTCGSCDVSDKICRYNLEPLEMMQNCASSWLKMANCCRSICSTSITCAKKIT